MRAACIILVLCGIHCGGKPAVVETDPASVPETPGPASPQPTPDSSNSTEDAGPAPVVDAGATPPANVACADTDPRATPVVLSVQPDDGEKAYVDLLMGAKTSIRVLGYEMGYGAVLDSLTTQAEAGVDVRVILDGVTQKSVNDKYRVLLETAGAKFEWSDPKFSYMHAKMMVADDRIAVVSTGNYAKSYIDKERNYVATISDPQDVRDLAALFDADWTMMSPNLTCTRLLVSPVNSRDRLVALIASAQTTIVIESMQYDDMAVLDAVLARKAAGVDVRVLLAAPTWIAANTAAGAALLKSGIPARWLAAPAVHVKSMIIDGARAYVGSENISYTSLSKNREVGVILSDPPVTAKMSETFEADWAIATSF